MIRKSTININECNTGKKIQLHDIVEEYKRVVNIFIDYLWKNDIKKGSFVKDTNWMDTWLTARMKQAAAKQALGIVKSQRKKKKPTKPVFRKSQIEFDSRFVDIHQDINSFDIWIKLTSIGNKIKIWIPSKKHKHFNKLVEQGWIIKPSLRLRETDKGFFIDIYFEKPEPDQKPYGRTIGFDIGYKKLLMDSKGNKFGTDFNEIAENISSKVQGSNAFKRALTQRDHYINHVTSQIDLKGIKYIVVEDLKRVKHKSRGKINRSFNNKLQRWTYPKVLEKISRMCEEAGVQLIRIHPAYTSQTCNKCKKRDKKSRKGEIFTCSNSKCENHLKDIDADLNAAKNIRDKGGLTILSKQDCMGFR